MDRSGQGRSPVPHRRTTSVRRAPRYRERAERRVDRRDRDDRAPAGACVASAAGVRGPRAAARRSATSRRVDPSRRGLRYEAERYIAALRDWVERGASSRFALPGDEVVRRSRPIPPEVSSAAASFALGLALHRRGQSERAAYWFGEAMRLQPDNWTYRRQAWTLAGADRERFYATDWLTEVKRLGAETYYPPLEL